MVGMDSSSREEVAFGLEHLVEASGSLVPFDQAEAALGSQEASDPLDTQEEVVAASGILEDIQLDNLADKAVDSLVAAFVRDSHSKAEEGSHPSSDTSDQCQSWDPRKHRHHVAVVVGLRA